ncbi:MAG: cupin domain-containing protein [Candidatus Omnitrophica bacterium]|nr:cupin domain-containing protein [Candidatus Omnitrophota bacterium]MBI2495757.1 cupin domain-containing protein [Candidatus Omnitrophota bacterium]
MKQPPARKRVGFPVALTAKTVGAKLRALRKSQRVTLVELAKASGVDAATISRMETGKMTGTLESHLKLATALGVRLTELYGGVEEALVKDAVTVQPPSQRTDVYVHEAGKSSMALLTSDILKKKLMPALIAIEPGGSTQKEEARVGTEKFLYVLEGSLEARVGGATHVLKRGSSLYLDASISHSLRNPGAKIARCLSVTTPPVL